MSISKRRFKNAGAILNYFHERHKEEVALTRAKQARPFRVGDEIARRTVNINGLAYWVSTVIRADGSIEVWAKRYVDFDENHPTHEGFTMLAHLVPREE
jgi:hypothetical protein